MVDPDPLGYADANSASITGVTRSRRFTGRIVPSITSVSPASLGAGAPSQTVTVTGANFVSGAVARSRGPG